jgi:iron complex transport system ATP-binding protein
MKPLLQIQNLKIKLNAREIISGFNLNIESGRVYSLIGPNGSGKTTLLRAMSRNLKPAGGEIFLDGHNIFKSNTRTVARRMAVLSQSHNDNNDVSVKDLVTYGRFAHREWWKGLTGDDKKIVEWAISRTNLGPYEERKINTLSGGERQRAWIAMAIAQKPGILLLDEPTTFLDISHQLEILDLVVRLNREDGITVLMALHDINYAARYSDELIVVKNGRLYASGDPGGVISPQMLKEVFNIEAAISVDEESGKPVFFPRNVYKSR